MRRGALNRQARRLARHCATRSRGTGALLRSALVTGSIPGRAAESRAVAPAQTPGLSSRRGCRHEPLNQPKRVRRSSAKPPGRPSDPQTRTRDPENFRDPPAKVWGGGTCFVDVELDVQISLPVPHACLSARQQSESVRSRRAGGGLWGRSWLCAAPRGTRVAIWQLYQPQDLAMWP